MKRGRVPRYSVAGDILDFVKSVVGQITADVGANSHPPARIRMVFKTADYNADAAIVPAVNDTCTESSARGGGNSGVAGGGGGQRDGLARAARGVGGGGGRRDGCCEADGGGKRRSEILDAFHVAFLS